MPQDKILRTLAGDAIREGDRVYSFGDTGNRVYGTLIVNDHPATCHAYEWAVEYDDGESYCVIDSSQIFPA